MALTEYQIQMYKQEYNVPPDNEIKVFKLIPEEGKSVLEYNPVDFFPSKATFGCKAIVNQYIEMVVSFNDNDPLTINDPNNLLEEVV